MSIIDSYTQVLLGNTWTGLHKRGSPLGDHDPEGEEVKGAPGDEDNPAGAHPSRGLAQRQAENLWVNKFRRGSLGLL